MRLRIVGINPDRPVIVLKRLIFIDRAYIKRRLVYNITDKSTIVRQVLREN